jgi:hypothetical protein
MGRGALNTSKSIRKCYKRMTLFFYIEIVFTKEKGLQFCVSYK